jgi:hypothetical protein
MSTDAEGTKKLIRETFIGLEDGRLVDAYPVVRNGREVSIPRHKLTMAERNLISDTLRKMGSVVTSNC